MSFFANESIEKTWSERYRKNGETVEENLRRVAKHCAKTPEEEEAFYNVMLNKRFFPAGRTMSNSAIGSKLSLNNCFEKGMKVITRDGLKNIEDVKIGEYVLSADNKYHRVNNTMERDYNGDIIRMRSKYFYDDICCTPNHQFLTQNGWKAAEDLVAGLGKTKDYIKVARCDFDKKYEDVDLMEYFQESDTCQLFENGDGTISVRKLSNRNPHNDNVAWMKTNKPVNRFIKMTPEVRYLIGRWIGDGSLTRYKHSGAMSIIQIVFNAEKEMDAALKCKEIGEKAFGLSAEWRKTNQNVISLRWANEPLATWLLKEFGEKCSGKHLSKKYDGDIEILKGIFDADGSIYDSGSGGLVLKNVSLINWFRDAMFLNGYNTFSVKKHHKYREVYLVSYSTYIGKGRFNRILSKSYSDGRQLLTNSNEILSDYISIDEIIVEKNKATKVYNLSVEDEHSYTVNGVVCHNCFTGPQIQDNMEDIFEKVALGARTHQRGGGIGYDFSCLRPSGTPTSNDAIASGPVSFMDVFNAQTATILQGGRRGM